MVYRGINMATTWVVDSNCFIHLGSMAHQEIVDDLSKSIPGGIYVTPGVHGEVRTVRFQRWKNKPNLLDKLKPILTTIGVEDDQIRGLANQIGERAAPQDVDLSLMVLASKLAREGKDVTLVTDDFKMTTTSQKANLGFATCPPSTFLQRLAEIGPNASKSRFRSLSRRTRAAEMRYAISRVNEYDIQAKLTWMVDSLIESKPKQKAAEPQEEKSSDKKLIRALRKHLLGGIAKKSHLNALGDLPEICQPVSEFDEYLRDISESKSVVVEEKYREGISRMSSVLERIGLGLAPLDEEMAEIAHRAIAGHVYRMETCLAMLAKMNADPVVSRLHLSRALHSATLIDDRNAEMLATNQLGILALVRRKWERAAELFETADRQAQTSNNERLSYLVCAGMMRYLNGDEKLADQHLNSANAIISANEKSAASQLFLLGKNLLAVDEAGIAIEVLDEAMECAIEINDQNMIEGLAEYLVLANNALTEEENTEYAGLRKYIDKLNDISGNQNEEFKQKMTEIETKASQLAKSQIEFSDEWQDAQQIFGSSSKMTVLRNEAIGEDESLIIAQDSEIGIVGFWLPQGDYNVSAGQNVTIKNTKVKLAKPTEELKNKHNLSAVIAIQDSDKITFSANLDI